VQSDDALHQELSTRNLQARILSICATLCTILLFLSLGGCKRSKPGKLTSAQIHQITQEMAQAAAEIAPKGSVVKSRPSRERSSGTRGEELHIGLRGAADSPAETTVQQNLETIARRHGLSVDPEIASGRSVRMVLRDHGTITHRIEIEPLVTSADRSPASSQQPRLAIVMDDLGSDRTAADAIFALHVPVTVSILPFHAHSQEIARDARQRGCEVMLHLPMQSVANESAERQELRPGLSPEEVRIMVEQMLDAIPGANGVNNHQGSQATADPALMDALMRELKDEGVFYVDSRTTAATVAFDTAKREGVPTAFRNVPFLDDTQSKDATKRQLQLALRGAKQKGEAITIGHPHPTTLAALREMLPEAKKQGVQLVLVSELVH
jgi:polysaccharide deacetylase 2 family uncharacterized protein YibQ